MKKIKLDRSRVEITKNGICYRIGRLYKIFPFPEDEVLKLDSITWDYKGKVFFLNLGEHSFNINFADKFIEEVTGDYIVCERCGHFNATI